MKIIVQILIVSIFSLGIVSCKKDSKRGFIDVDKLRAEAQKIPLTTLAVSQVHHNFGDIAKGQRVKYTYKFTNTGDQPLVISTVKPACGCTVPDFTRDPILPGGVGEVTLSFDSSSFEGFQNKSADVFTNTEKSPVTIGFSINIIK